MFCVVFVLIIAPFKKKNLRMTTCDTVEFQNENQAAQLS